MIVNSAWECLPTHIYVLVQVLLLIILFLLKPPEVMTENGLGGHIVRFVALLGFRIMRFVALCGLSHIRFDALWGLSHYGVCRIVRFVAYLVCRIIGFGALWGLSHYAVCRQLWGLSLKEFVAVSVIHTCKAAPAQLYPSQDKKYTNIFKKQRKTRFLVLL